MCKSHAAERVTPNSINLILDNRHHFGVARSPLILEYGEIGCNCDFQ